MRKGQRSFQTMVLREKEEAKIRADDYLLFDRRKLTLSHLRKDKRGRLRILRTPDGYERAYLGKHAKNDESLICLVSLALLWNRLEIEVDDAGTDNNFLVMRIIKRTLCCEINPVND